MALVGNYSNSTAQTGSNYPLFRLYAKEELAIATIIEICLAAVGTFGNCTVSVAVVKNRAVHVASNFYMVSLALTDLLVTAFLVPMQAAQHLALFNGPIMEEAVVYVLGFIGRITILVSVSSIATLSMDRRMALKHPLKYHSIIRFAKGRAVKVILTIWVLSLAFTSLTLIPGVDDEVFLMGFASYVLVVFAVVLFAYANILYLVRQSARWRISATRLFVLMLRRMQRANARFVQVVCICLYTEAKKQQLRILPPVELILKKHAQRQHKHDPRTRS